MSPADHTIVQLRSATIGFNYLFSNEIVEARNAFQSHGEESPFHLLGLGVCAFLEAALGMETGLMTEATRCLSLSEAGAKKQMKVAKSAKPSHRFQAGIEWEIVHADAVVLLGLTNALSESYMGYLQCMYALNSAHSKFTKLYKTVFPTGLDAYRTPAASPTPSRKSSINSFQPLTLEAEKKASSSFFARWSGSSTLTVPKPTVENTGSATDGPIEDLIIAGTAFGFGLFNLVFSLLPARVQSVVGFFGFTHDKNLALQALAVAAAKKDVHSVFAGLVLMTYHGVVLLLSGYQADEAHTLKQYRAIVDNIQSQYPKGALWILNRAKILRMSGDPDGAIRVIQAGLKPEKGHTFAQADTLLVFELAWTLLAKGRYQEAADAFMRLTELNSWSHATYYFIAAGCYFSLGEYAKAQELFNTIPSLLDKKKISGKDLPTEVFIRKKLTFYAQKQARRGGDDANYIQAVKISPAEEIAIFWNTHARIEKSAAVAHIDKWSTLSPPVTIASPYITSSPTSPENATTVTSAAINDLDTIDEIALRSLLLGIVHRTTGSYSVARSFLIDAHKRQSDLQVNTWIGGVALFELAVLDLKECAMEAGESQSTNRWASALHDASEKLDKSLSLSRSADADLSGRLDSRIAMLRDEIDTKRSMLAEGK